MSGEDPPAVEMREGGEKGGRQENGDSGAPLGTSTSCGALAVTVALASLRVPVLRIPGAESAPARIERHEQMTPRIYFFVVLYVSFAFQAVAENADTDEEDD